MTVKAEYEVTAYIYYMLTKSKASKDPVRGSSLSFKVVLINRSQETKKQCRGHPHFTGLLELKDELYK